jgi:hypothetical protein
MKSNQCGIEPFMSFLTSFNSVSVDDALDDALVVFEDELLAEIFIELLETLRELVFEV